MLLELAVRDLGVIDELTLVLSPGMTAVTGETGAGKTLVVTAIELLVGGRADAGMVAPGRPEAVVEGRFLDGSEEVVVRRVVPASGRSRAYVDGRLAAVGELAELGRRLVDLHGQHAHQSLLAPAAQRQALDQYGSIDLAARRDARSDLATLVAQLEDLGGDEHARAREIDLLRYQVDELERAALRVGEDSLLDAEESLLADAVAHREAAARATDLIVGDDGAETRLGTALAAVSGRAPFIEIEARLRSVLAELGDLSHDLRTLGEGFTDDPERLAEIRERRQLIGDLRRKYGSTDQEVVAFAAEAALRLADLESHGARAADLEVRRTELEAHLHGIEQAIGDARRAAAPSFSTAVTAHLADLALPAGRLAVELPVEGVADELELVFTANAGSPLQPLRKVASGGELARVMLALRLVLTAGPDTLVFDEVDAGIGGTAALAVGASLAALGADHQVLVVTHLPQVAAHADAQVVVTKATDGGRTVTSAHGLTPDERVVELARMLSGTPDSEVAHDHAAELLASAAAVRDR